MSLHISVLYHNRLVHVHFKRPFGNNGQKLVPNVERYVVRDSLFDAEETKMFIARTYGDVAMRAVKYLAQSTQRSFRGCTVVGLRCLRTEITHYANELLPFKPAVLFRPSIEGQYALLLSGPINNLGDAFLQSLFLQYSNVPSSINTLIRVNKRFRRLFSSDEVWSHVRYPYSLWSAGKGHAGHENVVWTEFQHEHGLTIIGAYRYVCNRMNDALPC